MPRPRISPHSDKVSVNVYLNEELKIFVSRMTNSLSLKSRSKYIRLLIKKEYNQQDRSIPGLLSQI